jgi:hypothetical protein
MMLRCNFLFAFVLVAGLLHAQTPPPPPPSDWPVYVEPTQEERIDNLMDAHLTIDELLFPESRFDVEDEVYYETPDSVRIASKVKAAYFQPMADGQPLPVPVRYYSWYAQTGGVIQKAEVAKQSKDSVVHRWNRDVQNKITSYCILSYKRKTTAASKVNMSGDSVSITRDNTGRMIKTTRYSVFITNGVKSKNLVDTETFTYSPAGVLISRKRTDQSFTYTSDDQGRVVRVDATAKTGYTSMTDSFAWRSSDVADTIEHWVISKASLLRFTGMMEKLVINKTTGDQLYYELKHKGKFNYIRNVDGPIAIEYGYDAAGRKIRESYFFEGEMVFETVWTYNQSGILTSYGSIVQYNEEIHGKKPPMAANAKNIYITTVLSYKQTDPARLAERIELSRIMFDLTPSGSRTVLAEAQGLDELLIRCENYQP